MVKIYYYWQNKSRTSKAVWAFDFFEDMDIKTILFSGIFMLTPDDSYHFGN